MHLKNNSRFNNEFNKFNTGNIFMTTQTSGSVMETDLRLRHRLVLAPLEYRKEMFYLTTHSTHFIYDYMASDIW